jgi:hydroxyacylglutathione hydrolase
MQLRDNIYVYEWTDYFENNCNSYYIGGNVCALIDPGLIGYVPSLLERMENDGIDTTAIRYIVNTHSHPDHFEGSAYFYGQDIKIGLHEEEIKFLAGPGGELYDLFGLKAPTPNIDLFLSEGELILGGDVFQVLHVPGHSPGSIALYSSTRGALFSGDVVFDQSIGRTDFPGGDGRLLKNSITRLSELDAGSLLPGHMGIVEGSDQVRRNFKTILEYFAPYL